MPQFNNNLRDSTMGTEERPSFITRASAAIPTGGMLAYLGFRSGNKAEESIQAQQYISEPAPVVLLDVNSSKLPAGKHI